MSLLTVMPTVPTAARRFWTVLLRMLPARAKPVAAVPVKLDARLLADIGLTEQDVLSVERRYWREWEKSQRAWNL
ncbi:hypothetical protein [Aquibium sp. ELW1220]|uniref:hypothetical protein n=1 Tax=Aquibium sp. ELW1220 TaxID=2976766 RepID=UPI0025B09F3A|nr:hypothetical protein [Aquibium sp. ELW1220]MDN2579372.1 hypothetical protein [Aquibium sp. ELW1220]